MVVAREPEGPRPAEIDAVQAKIDIERGGEASWSSRQVAQVLNAPVPLHRVEPLKRFERPDQDAGADA